MSVSKYAQGFFTPKHPEKYLGKGNIRYRSSWERQFMTFCDTNKAIVKWTSESIRIPYQDPFTGKVTTYVPDFLIQYVDKNGILHTELIEIKPQNQTVLEKVGTTQRNQSQYIKNNAKWAAARAYCKMQGITFRVITEKDMFHNGRK
jgi:hypothetical protein